MTASAQTLRSFPDISTRPRARSHAEPPLLTLLRYVQGHRKYATLTAAFGVLGFLLSFVYPWLIGRAIDLVASGKAGALNNQALSELKQLTALGAVTGLLHAAVLYGRGHYNVHLGDSIIA